MAWAAERNVRLAFHGAVGRASQSASRPLGSPPGSQDCPPHTKGKDRGCGHGRPRRGNLHSDGVVRIPDREMDLRPIVEEALAVFIDRRIPLEGEGAERGPIWGRERLEEGRRTLHFPVGSQTSMPGVGKVRPRSRST